MAVELWTIEEVKARFQVSDEFIAELEAEEIVICVQHPREKARALSVHDIEKVRLASILVNELGVNLPGVEVILNMRSNMLRMRAQVDSILEHVSQEMRKRFEEKEDP